MSRNCLLLLRGLPASGKTTYCRREMNGGDLANFKRVNKDDLRSLIVNYKNHTDEKEIVEIEQYMALKFLANRNVVVDDTNLGDYHVNLWKNFIKTNGLNVELEAQWIEDGEEILGYENYELSIEKFWDYVERNESRPNKVPKGAIINLMLKNKLMPSYFKDKRFVLCDIDGTISNTDHRNHLVRGENKDWDSFFNLVCEDSYKIETISKLKEDVDSGLIPIFVTARPEKTRNATETWLLSVYEALYGTLFKNDLFVVMRPDDNFHKDYKLKEFYLKRLLNDLNIVKVYDDRPSVIAMWERNGLKVVDCGNGIDF